VFIDTSKNGINPSKPLVSPTEVSPLSTVGSIRLISGRSMPSAALRI